MGKFAARIRLRSIKILRLYEKSLDKDRGSKASAAYPPSTIVLKRGSPNNKIETCPGREDTGQKDTQMTDKADHIAWAAEAVAVQAPSA
jgi:hypothetical protein